MKREFTYERRQTASRMEAVMLAVSGVGVIAAIFALLKYGWFPSVTMLVLSAIAFALGRIFDLLGELFAAINSDDQSVSAGAVKS